MKSRSLRISGGRDRLVSIQRWTTNFIYASYPEGSIRHMMTGPYESLRDLKEEVNLALAEAMLMPRTPVRLGLSSVGNLERWFDRLPFYVAQIGIPVLGRVQLLDDYVEGWKQQQNLQYVRTLMIEPREEGEREASVGKGWTFSS